MDTATILQLVKNAQTTTDDTSIEMEETPADEMEDVSYNGTLLSLPQEVLQRIFSHLTLKDSAMCARVSWMFNRHMMIPCSDKRTIRNVDCRIDRPLAKDRIQRRDISLGSCFMFTLKMPKRSNNCYCNVNLKIQKAINCHYKFTGGYHLRTHTSSISYPLNGILTNNYFERKVELICTDDKPIPSDEDKERIEALFIDRAYLSTAEFEY